METAPNKRLHPLLTAAAVSVTIFSAVGVGALTGLLPISHSTTQPSTPPEFAAPAQPVSSTPAPAVASSATAPAAAPAPEVAATANADSAAMPPAAATSTPAKPVHKKVAKAPQAPKPAPHAYEAPQVAAATIPPPPPAAAPVEAPRPVVQPGTLGVVESVKEVSQPAEKSNGIGPIAGGIAGAVLGHQVGNGTGKTIATVLGAAGGALGGREIEQRARATKHWDITVRLDDGSTRTLTSNVAPYWHGGERVRLVDGKLNPA
jgi:outer membrane lipoprotein SlyB